MSKQPTSRDPADQPSAADQALLKAIAGLTSEAGPTAALDQAILAASRRAVRARPMARMRPWLSAAAAVFVAFFAANLLLTERASDSVNAIQRSAPEAEQALEVQLFEDTDDRRAAGGEEADQAADGFGGDFEAPKLDRAAAPAVRPAAPPAPPSQPAAAPAAAEPILAPTPLAPEPPAPQPPAAAARKPLPDPFPGEPTGPASAAEPAAESAGAVSEDAPVAALAAPSLSKRYQEPSAGRSQATSLADPSTAASAPISSDQAQPQRSRQSGPRPAPAQSKTTEETSQLTPEQWFGKLRELQANGELDQARAVLDQFRAAYPQLPLPPDLRWLEAPES